MNLKLLGAVAALALMVGCADKTAQNQAQTGAGGAGAGAGTGAGSGSGYAPGSQQDLAATAGDRVFFDTDSSVVREDGRSTLQKQAQWMSQNANVRVRIEGNADERGTREYNYALGQRRANAARDQLVANGVSGARVSVISYGKDRPASLGSTDDAWAQNRSAVTAVR